MTVRIEMWRKLKVIAFTLFGAWLGVRLGTPLDDVFTGEGTIAFVFLTLGAWLGSMIGGTGLADTVHSFRHHARRSQARLLGAVAIVVGAVAVVAIADSSMGMAGLVLGAGIAVYLSARDTEFRYLVAALLLGAFAGAVISAAGGKQAVGNVLEILAEGGIEAVIERGQDGDLRHWYLGQDREDGFLASLALGYMAASVISMIAFFVSGLLGSGKMRVKGKSKR